MGIEVEDAPFLGVEMVAEGEGAERRLSIRTNVGDIVAAGPEHPLRFETEAETGGLKPYVRVRGGLEALLTRSLTLDLVAIADERDGAAGIWSGGAFFAFPRSRPWLTPRLYSAEDFRRRVGERLSPDRGSAVGDHAFNPEIADAFLRIERRPAAVLVPVIHREPEATLLFTERVGGLGPHAGQIAFPGGRIDPEDAGPEAAALREAQEEIGLDARISSRRSRSGRTI